MAMEYAKWFYNSTRWQKTRDAYYSSIHGLCEEEGCTEACEIIHHVIPITRKNINDYNITLNWDNLQGLCREHHSEKHRGKPSTAEGIKFDEEGNVIYEAEDIS